jgi:hypothetical protein
MKRNPDVTFVPQAFSATSRLTTNEWGTFSSCIKHLFPRSSEPQYMKPVCALHVCFSRSCLRRCDEGRSLLLPSYGTVAWRGPTPPGVWRINETPSTVDEVEITEIQIHYKTSEM